MQASTSKRLMQILLLFLCAVTAIKILLVGYDIDEQYAITMSYRLLQGDFPLLTMWEPHQTSAFLSTLLMLPYLLITKSTTGIVLWLRLTGLAIHSLVTFSLYRYLLKKYSTTVSMLICCLYFFSLPKLMFLPEFSNMQTWFLILLILSLLGYYQSEREKVSLAWLVFAGICMMFEVICYPSSILVFPVCLYFIVHYRKQERHSLYTELFCFVLPCFIGAMIFFAVLLSRMNLSQLLSMVSVVAADGSHSASLFERMLGHLSAFRTVLIYFLIYSIISGLLHYIVSNCKKQAGIFGGLLFSALFLAVTLLGQLLIWLFGNSYPNYPLTEYFFLPLFLLIYSLRKKINASYELSFFVILPLTAFIGIVLFSNHTFLVSAPFLVPCVIGILTLPELMPFFRTADAAKKERNWSLVPILTLWVILLLFGRIYMVRTTGGLHYTIFDSLSLMRSGPAAGIICDTETATKYRDTLELVSQSIPDDASVFYAGVSNDIYLMKDMKICTPSTISTPTFDNKIMDYFSMNPHKQPEYVVCGNEQLMNVWVAEFLSDFCELLDGNYFIQIYRCSLMSE